MHYGGEPESASCGSEPAFLADASSLMSPAAATLLSPPTSADQVGPVKSIIELPLLCQSRSFVGKASSVHQDPSLVRLGKSIWGWKGFLLPLSVASAWEVHQAISSDLKSTTAASVISVAPVYSSQPMALHAEKMVGSEESSLRSHAPLYRYLATCYYKYKVNSTFALTPCHSG